MADLGTRFFTCLNMISIVPDLRLGLTPRQPKCGTIPSMTNLHIFAAGTAAGSFSPGVERGPEAILETGCMQTLGLAFELQLHQARSVAVAGSQKNQLEWLIQLQNDLSAVPVSDQLLVLGGDHSLAAPSLLASARRLARPAIVYVDAHPDCHRLETSTTGNLHGMPITIATGETFREIFPSPYMDAADICFIGIKDIDEAEQHWLDSNHAVYFTMDRIIEEGIGSVMQSVNRWVGTRSLHVSFDIDAVDAYFAPGTGIRNAGGLTYREASYIARQLGYLRPKVVDMVEVNPARDEDRRTAFLAAELTCALFGLRFDSYQRYLDGHTGDHAAD